MNSKRATAVLLTLLLVTTRSWVIAQKLEIVPVQVAEELSFSGTIGGKYRITMTIREEKSVNYAEDGCFESFETHLSGWYSYHSVGERIELVGTRTDEGKVILYELDTAFSKSATFTGNVKGHQLTGTWTHLENGKTLPFQLEETTLMPQQLGLRITGEQETLRSVLLFPQPNDYRQASYDVKFNQKKGDTYYLLLSMYTPSCGVFNCRGACCGGLEEALVWTAVNDQGDIEDKQSVVISSCHDSIYADDSSTLTENSSEIIRVVVNDIRSDTNYTVEFDPSQPEQGLLILAE